MRALGMTLLLVTASVAHADSFEGSGRAPISGGDRVKARDRALDEAFQHALEAAISSLLGPDTLVKKAGDLRLRIMPRARSYVGSYRILDEGDAEPGYVSVHVGAEVQADRLVRELSGPVVPVKPAAPTAPRMAICVRAGADAVPLPRFDEALRARLEAHGVLVVDAGCAATNERVLVAELEPGTVAPIRGTAFVGREAKLTLGVVEIGSRRSVESRARAAGWGATPSVALDDAALAALPDAVGAIDDAFGKSARSESGVTVRVAGVRRLTQVTLVRAALERLPGVETVELRRFAPASGPVDLLVKTGQSEHGLFEALQRTAPSYRLRPREADGGIVVDVPDASDAAGAP